MDEDFDILSLLVEEKSKQELINDAIEIAAKNGYQSKELFYQVIVSDFKQWLIDKGFMADFLQDDVKNEEIEICVSQAVFSFVYFRENF